ncbi:MAG: nodulation protein NfeD [Treponema sp.]|jgi:membrane-bound serine protease (ClpP class)|nr:nodulation protein NfeD [Treponema sp.]
MKLLSKTIYAGLIGLFLFFSSLPATAQETESVRAPVRIIPIKGDIEPALAAFVRREAQKAQNEKAEYIVFEIDTFGGRVDSALQIASYIMSIKNARTIAWVRSGESSMGVSWSAGALIAFSCAEIYMASGTSIGAAAPVEIGADGSTTASGEKTVAAVRSQMAALAERNGHPVDVALAMVDFDIELWEVQIDGETRAISRGELERLESRGAAIERIRVISLPGKLLSLTAGEAYLYGLSSGLVEDQEGLLAALGASGEIIIETGPGFADQIISFLTSSAVQVILIIAGLILLFIELNTPGFGVPGVLGIICFLTVLGTGVLLGRVDSLEIILFILGLGLLAVEIFVIPGFGVVGVLGFLLIGLSLIFSMQDFIIPSLEWEWALFGRNALIVFVSLLSAATAIAMITLFGPRLKIFDILTLNTQITGTAGGPDPDGDNPVPALKEDEENYAALTGKIGVTDTVLRPSGRAVFDGKVYAVEADGDYIDVGRGIIVTKVRGNRIIVRRV